MKTQYESPLSSRYASEYMLKLFSADTRYQTWRKLWVSLAKAEMELGLPITEEQVQELQAHVTDIDYGCVSQREKEVRHDVMGACVCVWKSSPNSSRDHPPRCDKLLCDRQCRPCDLSGWFTIP